MRVGNANSRTVLVLLSDTLHYCCDHCQSDQKDRCILDLFSSSLAKPEGHLLCGYVHELDYQIVANRQFDRHNC